MTGIKVRQFSLFISICFKLSPFKIVYLEITKNLATVQQNYQNPVLIEISKKCNDISKVLKSSGSN